MTDSVVSIGKESFECCEKLATVKISSNIESIGDYAFRDCTVLNMEIPKSVKTIGANAFEECNALDGDIVLDYVESIGDWAFWVTKITSVNIKSGSMTTLGQHAFQANHYLESVILPEGLETIGYQAFCLSENIKEITLPASLKTINSSAFNGCSGITDVYYRGGIADWGNISVASSNTSLTSATIHYLGEKYAVVYDANGGTDAPTAQSKIYQTSLELTTDIPTKTGYIFSNWNTNRDGSGTSYSAGETYTADAPVTLYAQWSPVKYYVAYNANGAAGSMTNQAYYYDEEQALKTCTFTKVGHSFGGWKKDAAGDVMYADGEIVKNLTTTNNDIVTIYAAWIPDTYEISFSGNGAEEEYESINVEYGAVYGALPVATKTGHTFKGWFIGDTEITSDTIVNITASTTLQARWEANNYKVIFDANGGVAAVTEITVTYGSAYGTLPIPVYEGYKFMGWYCGEVQILPETKVEITEPQTLQAKWVLAPYTTFKIEEYTAFDFVKADLFNLEAGCTVIMAAYKNEVLSDVQSGIYDGNTVPFIVYEDYDTIKIMVWSSLEALSPLCDVNDTPTAE